MNILDRKEEVIGIISASLWATVGDDNHTLGQITHMEIHAEVIHGQTVPIIEVYGSRGTAAFNYDHVEAVIFAPTVEEPKLDEVPF